MNSIWMGKVTFDHVKEVYGKQRNKIMEVAIQNDTQSLSIADSAYFPITESAITSDFEIPIEETAFYGIADEREQ